MIPDYLLLFLLYHCYSLNIWIRPNGVIINGITRNFNMIVQDLYNIWYKQHKFYFKMLIFFENGVRIDTEILEV